MHLVPVSLLNAEDAMDLFLKCGVLRYGSQLYMPAWAFETATIAFYQITFRLSPEDALKLIGPVQASLFHEMDAGLIRTDITFNWPDEEMAPMPTKRQDWITGVDLNWDVFDPSFFFVDEYGRGSLVCQRGILYDRMVNNMNYFLYHYLQQHDQNHQNKCR